ncbi:MAG: hypothetical protein QXT73_02380 [Candidatus Methanomethylicaceae archaeon]
MNAKSYFKTAAPAEEITKILIATEAKAKLDFYIRECGPIEVSGLGLVSTNPLRIDDVILLEQKSSAASTDLLVSAVGRWLTDFIREGGDSSRVRLWWHSHLGQVFWSTTDVTTIEAINGEWLVSVVGNAAGEYLARIDLFQPFRVAVPAVLVPDISLPLETQERLRQEMQVKVKKARTYYPYVGGTTQWETDDFGVRWTSCRPKS